MPNAFNSGNEYPVLFFAVRQTHTRIHARFGTCCRRDSLWYLPTIPLNTHVCIIYSVTYTYIYTCMHILSIFLFPFAKKKIEGKALLFPPGIYADVPYPFYSCSCVHLTRPSYPFRLALFGTKCSSLATLKNGRKSLLSNSFWNNLLTISVVLRLVQGS